MCVLFHDKARVNYDILRNFLLNYNYLNNMSITVSLPSRTRTLVREYCKGDDASQWENGKFDTLLPPNPLTDRHKKLHT